MSDPYLWVGWLSSVILVPSLAKQTYKQWKDDTSQGVSVWLYLGSLVASMGFVTYAAHTGDKVFVVTNSLIAIDDSLGLLILYRHRRRERQRSALRAHSPEEMRVA